MPRSDYRQRRSIRLNGFDYRRAGAYFVTLCSHGRECIFAEIDGETPVPTALGKIVISSWLWLAEQYSYVELDAWVLMPNHLHGILVIMNQENGAQAAHPRSVSVKPLGQLIGAFKTRSTREANDLRMMPGATLWQRDFYEHIIQDEDQLNRIRCYIAENPLRWAIDAENPVNHIR